MLADDSDEESAVVRKEKKLTKGKLFQKTNSKAHNKPSGTTIVGGHTSYISVVKCSVSVGGGVYGESDSDSETAEGSQVTLAYKSKRTSEREGLQDMGATLTLETESTTKVCWITNSVQSTS